MLLTLLEFTTLPSTEKLRESRFTLGDTFAEYCSRPRVLSLNPTGKAEFAENQNTGTRQSLCRVLKRGFGNKKKDLTGRTETADATWQKLCRVLATGTRRT
jgi:hypothetical protein